MSKNLTYLGIQNPFESDESKHHFKPTGICSRRTSPNMLKKWFDWLVTDSLNYLKLGHCKKSAADSRRRYHKEVTIIAALKGINLPSADQPYQLRRSLLRQQAPAFHILKMPCCWFYNALHSTVTSINIHARVKPHKVYRRRTIRQLVHCMKKNLPLADYMISITKMFLSARDSYISYSQDALPLIVHFITLYWYFVQFPWTSQATQRLPSS